MKYIQLAITLAFFGGAVVATVAIAIHFHLREPWLLAFFIGVTMLLLIFVARSSADAAGAHLILFYGDAHDIDPLLKADDAVLLVSGLAVVLKAFLNKPKKESRTGSVPPKNGA